MYKTIFILSISFLSFNSLALESLDKLKTQILKIYDRNVIVINRGLEDAIFKSDHGKLTSDDGFIARGICIKATMQTSHWKIYRVVRPQLVSKDSEYTLNSINQSEIPLTMLKFSSVDFSEWYNDYDDRDRKKVVDLQQERIANYDLPQTTKSTQATKEMETTGFDRFIDKNFDDKVLQGDLRTFYLDFYASPITLQTRFDQKEVNYGVRLYNLGDKYRFDIRSHETQSKIVDPVSRKGYSAKSSRHSINFEFHKLAKYLSIYSFLDYRKEKIGNTYYPYDHYRIAILGAKIHLWEKNPKTDFADLSYAPVFDNIKFTNPLDTDDLLERDGIRHHIRLRIHGTMTERITNQTEFIYSPLIELASSNFDFEDTYIHAKTNFAYRFTEQFYWDYILEFERDDLRDRVYDVTPDNITQTFRFRYEFPL